MARVSQRNLFESAYSLEIEPLNSGQGPLVLAIPGFRTNGEWISTARLEGKSWQTPIEIRVAHGDPLGELALLARWQIASQASTVRNQIVQEIINNPGRRISVVCHSLGCEVFRRAVKDLEYQFDVVVLLGSVCSRRHAVALSKTARLVVNDRGAQDWWSVAASWLCPPAFGHTGAFGFRYSSIVDRLFDNGHGSCTECRHMVDFVFPVLTGQAAEEPRDVCMKIPFNMVRYVSWAIQGGKLIFSLAAIFAVARIMHFA